MGIPLSEATIRLVDGKNYAVLATVNPDGSPQTSVVWVGRDGDDLLFSTVEGRGQAPQHGARPAGQRQRDRLGGPGELRRAAWPGDDDTGPGPALDTQLSWKYDGRDPGQDRPGAVRVVVRMVVEKATGYAS